MCVTENIAVLESGNVTAYGNDRYQGRLRISSQGSLIINDLRIRDTGRYRAVIRDDDMVCFRLFHFIVQRKISSEDIKINYVMTNREPCHINVFCAVHGIKAAVSWNISHGEGTVAQLQFPSLHTVPYFDEYKGISGSVLNVSRVNPELTYSCTAKTRFSTASRSATPWEYCQQGKYPQGPYLICNPVGILPAR
ncbi:hypothetical protein XENTR_v10022560 [Xenopus tropicalis]|nr:hypothetical protein XENTR_v10022560 [Xenopus tropicalis]